jgi:outer membrane protein TolC
MTRATSKWVGVSVSVPVFTGFQRGARIQQSKAVLSQVRNQAAMARSRPKAR